MPHGPYPAGDTRIMLTSSPELARLALQDAPEAMILVDAAGTVVFANLQAGRLFGFAQEALIGRTLDSLVPRRLREAHAGQADRNHRSPLARPVDQRLELYGVRHDGTEFPVEVSLGPIGSEGGSIVAAAIRDASEHRRIQGELTAARTTAEKALESAVRANQAKSRFLATASHDLRQPLQTLALLNGTLRRMVPDVQAARVLEQQENAIGAMSRLINALLDISELESGSVKPEITDFPVAAIFEELRREFSDMAARKQLEFEITQAPQYARSDPSLVEQVLRNLLSNALKYTRRGKVALRCLLAPDSLLRLEVLDSGIGIPPDHLGSIYDEFYQMGPTPTGRVTATASGSPSSSGSWSSSGSRSKYAPGPMRVPRSRSCCRRRPGGRPRCPSSPPSRRPGRLLPPARRNACFWLRTTRGSGMPPACSCGWKVIG